MSTYYSVIDVRREFYAVRNEDDEADVENRTRTRITVMKRIDMLSSVFYGIVLGVELI